MRGTADEFLTETTRKLIKLHAQLAGTPRPRWDLIGTVRELAERCQILQELGANLPSRAVSQLVIDVVSLEKLAGGAPACDMHPARPATRSWEGAPVCQECSERLEQLRHQRAKDAKET
jgi:hypothetical protein